MDRKLVTLQRIHEIKSIKDADKIELAMVQGWQCVVKKGEFQLNDLCVFFEVDSFLPMDEKYAFLASCYKKNEYMGEGYRIKTVKLRGQLSQGLILPLIDFQDIDFNSMSDGADLTDLLRVKKWELPEVSTAFGLYIKREMPYNIPKTDETRLQTNPGMFLQTFQNKEYYITTKMDGTSQGNSIYFFSRIMLNYWLGFDIIQLYSSIFLIIPDGYFYRLIQY